MTNMVDSIDPAILRRGRFDHLIEVKMPSADEVASLLQSLFSRLPIQDDVELQALAEKLKGRPMSDVAFVVKEAGRIAVKSGKESIDRTALETACNLLPPAKGQVRKIGFSIETEHESV
jgi:ATP-dependent 26S proteasome regulatory subunit